MVSADEHAVDGGTAEDQMVRRTIDVPSGLLLISDVIDIDGLRDAIDNVLDDRRGMTLNTAAGRNHYTEVYADDLRMGFAATGNTDVTILREIDGARILIVDGLRGAEGWKAVGQVGCTTWCVTVADREIAVRILGGKGEDDEETQEMIAEAEIEMREFLAMSGSDPTLRPTRADAMIRNRSANVVRLEVPAGTWEILAGDQMSEMIDRKEHRLPDDLHLWMLLTPPL